MQQYEIYEYGKLILRFPGRYRISGQLLTLDPRYDYFVPGDEIEIEHARLLCPDLGCEPIIVTFSHPDVGRGIEAEIWAHQLHPIPMGEEIEAAGREGEGRGEP